MASILDRYGIKEVADVVFWDTSSGKPVLYLDTLKVSTIEETAEQTEARGGKGNPPLIIWDYGKEITITLEDALFSMKSMSLMHNQDTEVITPSAVRRGTQFVTDSTNATIPSTIPSNADIYNAEGLLYDPNAAEGVSDKFRTLEPNTKYLAGWIEPGVTDAKQIVVKSNDFPGTYRITGDTYARSQDTGKDEYFQFEVPLAKINPEQTITMQAEGDPSTFSMTVRVMRPSDGKMMTLTKYSIAEQTNYSISRGGDSEEQTLAVNGTKTLAPVVTPAGSTISWQSADETKATVANGVVTGVAATGETPVVITATLVDDSSKSVSYRFTITAE